MMTETQNSLTEGKTSAFYGDLLVAALGKDSGYVTNLLGKMTVDELKALSVALVNLLEALVKQRNSRTLTRYAVSIILGVIRRIVLKFVTRQTMKR